jgi:hypothetical protein
MSSNIGEIALFMRYAIEAIKAILTGDISS